MEPGGGVDPGPELASAPLVVEPSAPPSIAPVLTDAPASLAPLASFDGPDGFVDEPVEVGVAVADRGSSTSTWHAVKSPKRSAPMKPGGVICDGRSRTRIEDLHVRPHPRWTNNELHLAGQSRRLEKPAAFRFSCR